MMQAKTDIDIHAVYNANTKGYNTSIEIHMNSKQLVGRFRYAVFSNTMTYVYDDRHVDKIACHNWCIPYFYNRKKDDA